MKLAINGGEKLRKNFFPYQTTIDNEEKKAIERVMDSKQLSSFRGSWNPAFRGGLEIQSFENEWQNKYNVKHAITCNSCTSALTIACRAIGLKEGDEVIVSPYTMTCSATMPLECGATPIFADVEPDNYCLDPNSVEKYITKKTKAVIAVNIFGNPIDVEGFKRLKEKYGIYIIEDAAQSVGAMYKNDYAGTFGDIGCFSFTQGKHLTCGEGGLLTTNNDELALNCRLVMNHAESVINDMLRMGDMDSYQMIKNKKMIGMNLRMTEMCAAIMREQLKKIDFILNEKRKNCEYLENELNKLPGIKATGARKDCIHSYYVQPFLFDETIIGISRHKFIEAFKAELMPEDKRDVEGVGILVGQGYIQPLYRMPIFADKFNPINYPVVEELYSKKLFIFRMSAPPITIENDLIDVVGAFKKVYENINELK